jgi:hypothetical protein
MREIADRDRIERFMQAISGYPREPTRIYFAGGATAVLLGWRSTTIDVDIKIVPDRDDVMRAIPRLKEDLQINVELAVPSDFIPVREDWERRSPFIERIELMSFHHFDLYAQALSKIERGHVQDADDVAAMFTRGLIQSGELRKYFTAIEPMLYRYPAIDPPAFRDAVTARIRELEKSHG